MNKKKIFSGNLSKDGFLKILFKIYIENLEGTLTINYDDIKADIVFKDSLIIFASSNSKVNTLGAYLVKNKVINGINLKVASDYSSRHNKRLGRALLELKLIDNDTLWTSVKGHLRELILCFFYKQSGLYEFSSDMKFEEENITLDLTIPNLLIEGSRLRTNESLIEEKLAATSEVYPLNYSDIENLNLKPYELHILKIIQKEHIVKNIIFKSELLRIDTLKLLDVFITMKIITNNKDNVIEADKIKNKQENKISTNNKASGLTSFVSFSEALKYYNTKYELIYKVFSKEIGPIALSILQKSINDILDNLPNYFQKIKWNDNGTINEEHLLKLLYHKDFQENIREFLTGLDEILYSGIYTIRKNISPEKEKVVLKWINRPAK